MVGSLLLDCLVLKSLLEGADEAQRKWTSDFELNFTHVKSSFSDPSGIRTIPQIKDQRTHRPSFSS